MRAVCERVCCVSCVVCLCELCVCTVCERVCDITDKNNA